MSFGGKGEFRKLSGPTIEVGLDGSAGGVGKAGEGNEESALGRFFLELGGAERVGGGYPAPRFGAIEAEGADTEGDGLRRGERWRGSGKGKGEKS